MVNKNYVNGRAREYRIKHRLEKEGWTVFRMAGSHTKIDLIAMKNVPGTLGIAFYQCKPSFYLTPAEREEKAALEKKLGIVIEVMTR